MSILIAKMQCEKCHNDWHLSSWTAYFYDLPTVGLVSFSPNVGWCRHCACATRVLPEHRNMEIAKEYQALSKTRIFEHWRRDRRERLARVAQLKDFLTFGDRGAVCATCGLSNVTSCRPSQGFEHPGCGGVIRWKETGIRMAFAGPPEKAVYSPNGRRLNVDGPKR